MTENPAGDGGGNGPSLSELRIAVVREIATALTGVPAEDVPGRLCAALLNLLPVTGLALNLTAEGIYSTTLGATDATASRLADIQFTLGEGPGVRAAEVSAPVLAPDLSQDARRWPLFVPQALQTGARAMYAIPLGNSTVVIGTLDLYRDTAGRLAPADLASAVLAADASTAVLAGLDHGKASPEGVASWLHGAGEAHNEVYQAAGMLMAQLGAKADEALLLLRARAFREGRTATEVAEDVLLRRIDFTEND
ncbi:ANTAR domain-containing protein [Streptomyces racemochromogenes]|uniref:ANTAR domain-containing protein n=1 Tax=Streptomyces racemochromogenes TaxID=67353 RepID=A0ABW7PE96_9ACTN